MSSSTSRSTPLPSFLDPTPSELNQIYKTLSAREQGRRILAQRSLTTKPSSSSSSLREEEAFSVRVGTSREHMNKNRYGDIIAYDSSRILLSRLIPETSYVNASLIREPDLGFESDFLPRRYWIAAQGPVDTTVPAFLSLLLSPPSSPCSISPLPLVQLIVQLTPLVEQNREKCSAYFPNAKGEEWVFDREDCEGQEEGIWVRYEGRDTEGGEVEGERRSWLRLGKEGDEKGRRVLHVEYLGWRDHGVPSSPSHLLSFIRRMNNLNASLSSSQTSNTDSTLPPILLHCSAGVGRTGTYLSISSLLPLLSLLRSQPHLVSKRDTTKHPLGEDYPAEKMIRDGVDHVGLTVDRIRDQRTTMVQTREQLAFVYEALRVAWEEGETR